MWILAPPGLPSGTATRSFMLTVLLLPLLLCTVSADEKTAPRLWTVFCAECTHNFDYKSIGVYWSHKLSGMPGGVTRLLACDETQLATYKGLNLGRTFVHKNYARMTHHRPEKVTGPLPYGARETDGSPSYNKPGSIMHWVNESAEAQHVDYVLYIDADMLLRLPMDPIEMGVRPGVVVSEHVGYLDEGIRNGLPQQFLPPEAVKIAGADLMNYAKKEPRMLSAGGWYHFFHIDDIRKIAHRWFFWCREMRLNPQKYWRMIDPVTGQPSGVDHDIKTGDSYVTHGQAPWISEMYGYVFAAAEAGLLHILTDGVVVYPDEIGSGRPEEAHIIHYGLHCAVGSFRFTKYTFGGFNAIGCTGKLFGDPPAPTYLERLCAETVLTLNDAMCDFYNRPESANGCGLKPQIKCPAWEMFGKNSCSDRHSQCKQWAEAGECTANPGFMRGNCPESCGECAKPPSTLTVPVWARALGRPHSGGDRGGESEKLATGSAKKALEGLPAAADAEASTESASNKRIRLLKRAAEGIHAARGRDRRLIDSSSTSPSDPEAAEDEDVVGVSARDDATHAANDAKAPAKEPVDAEPDGVEHARAMEGKISDIRILFAAVWVIVLAVCVYVVALRFCRRKPKPGFRNV